MRHEAGGGRHNVPPVIELRRPELDEGSKCGGINSGHIRRGGHNAPAVGCSLFIRSCGVESPDSTRRNYFFRLHPTAERNAQRMRPEVALHSPRRRTAHLNWIYVR